MKYYKIKTKNKRFMLIIPILCFVLCMLLSFYNKNIKVYSGDNAQKSDRFYMKVLNYTLPIIKVGSLDKEQMKQYDFSLKSEIMSVLGFNINKPNSILGKEVSYLKRSDQDINVEPVDSKQETNFNPFKLDDKSVSKNDKKNQKEDENIPNRTVTLYNPKLKKKLNKKEKPAVFIYHTHTTESFIGGLEGSNCSYDSTDKTKNICAVGDVITNELEKNYGILVLHDTTFHNRIKYKHSYLKSEATVDKYLKKYGDFKLIIDLHRDSIENKRAVTTQMNGEKVAKFMFVMSRGNPHFDKNMKVVNSMLNISNKLFPGFCRGALCYNHGTRNFNQTKSNNSILIELGSHVNSLDEAKRSGKYIARIIAEYLNTKK